MTRTHLSWAPERFYWSVLESPQWRRAGPLPAGLRSFIEDDAPLESGALWAVAAPLADGRLLVCAAPISDLESLDGAALTLTPEAIPRFAEAGVAPAALNLLVGQYEPRSVRRRRTRRHALAAASVLLTTALLALGLLRRESFWDQSARERADATATLVQLILPNGTPATLEAQVLRMRRLRDEASRIRPPIDASPLLGALLRAWPSAVSSKPLSLAMTEAGASVSVTVEGNAAPFLSALKPPPGWAMDEPHLSSVDALTRLTLHLSPPTASGSAP